jgi:hypothetical protein
MEGRGGRDPIHDDDDDVDDDDDILVANMVGAP